MRVIIISLLIFTACEQINVREYQYVETSLRTDETGTTPQEAKPIMIRAVSDSDAYVKAYMNFCISKRFYTDEYQRSGALAGKPVSFKILNEKGKDITQSISFVNKDSLKKDIEKRINKYQPDKQ